MEKFKTSDIERVKKIRAHCINIFKVTRHSTIEEFKSEHKVDAREACAFRLFQIGEHSNKISKDFKVQYDDINWKALYHFRNVLGHDYDNVSYTSIWKICKEDVPKLLECTDKIIKEIHHS